MNKQELKLIKDVLGELKKNNVPKAMGMLEILLAKYQTKNLTRQELVDYFQAHSLPALGLYAREADNG